MATPAPDLQGLYEEISHRGLLKTEGSDLQQLGHELRARGIIKDPTQGGLEPSKTVGSGQPAVGSGGATPAPAPATGPRFHGGAPPVLPQVPGAPGVPGAAGAMGPKHGSVGQPAPIMAGVRGEGSGVSGGVAPPPSDHHSLTPSPHHSITPGAQRPSPGYTVGGKTFLSPEATAGAIGTHDPLANPLFSDMAPPPAVRVPKIAPLSYGRLPEEERFRASLALPKPRPTGQIGSALGTLGAGSERRAAQTQATLDLARRLFTGQGSLANQWGANEAKLKAEGEQLSAAWENAGGLSSRELHSLERNTALFKQQQAAHAERGKLIQEIGRRYQGVQQTFGEVPFHTGVDYPEEPHAATWHSRIGDHLPEWVRTGLNFLSGGQAAEARLKPVIAQMQLDGEYPPPVPLPQMLSPSGRAQLIGEKNQLVSKIGQLIVQNSLTGANEPVKTIRQVVDQLRQRPPTGLSRWQQAIYSTVLQQVWAEGEARVRAGVVQGYTKDALLYGLIPGVSKLAEGPAAALAARLGLSRVPPIADALVNGGRNAFLKSMAARGAEHALHGGLTLAGASAPIEAAAGFGEARGTTRQRLVEAAKAGGTAAAGGFATGAAFAAVLSPFIEGLRLLKRGQYVPAQHDPLIDGTLDRAQDQATRAGNPLTPTEREAYHRQFRDLMRAAPVDRPPLLKEISESLRARVAQPAEARPTPKRLASGERPVAAEAPTAPPPAPERPAAPFSALRERETADLQAEHDAIMQKPGRSPAEDLHAQHLEAILSMRQGHAVQQQPALSPDQLKVWSAGWVDKKNPAHAQAQTLWVGANRLGEKNPALAQKLSEAARDIQAAHRVQFAEGQLSGNELQDLPNPVPPPTSSAYRQLTPAERQTLRPAETRALLLQDIGNSQQVLEPGHPGVFALGDVPGGVLRSVKALGERADRLYAAAQEKFNGLGPTSQGSETRGQGTGEVSLRDNLNGRSTPPLSPDPLSLTPDLSAAPQAVSAPPPTPPPAAVTVPAAAPAAPVTNAPSTVHEAPPQPVATPARAGGRGQGSGVREGVASQRSDSGGATPSLTPDPSPLTPASKAPGAKRLRHAKSGAVIEVTEPGKPGEPFVRVRVVSAGTDAKLAGFEGKTIPVPRDALAKGWTEAAPAGPAVTGFTTSQGSTYTVDEAGRTQRTKSPHPGHEPTDVGLKAVSDRTFYVSEADSQRAGMHGALSGKKALRIAPDGKTAQLLAWNEKAGKWGMTAHDRANPLPLATEPEVGLHPLELGRADAQGHVTKWHPGNAITEVTRGTTDVGIAGKRGAGAGAADAPGGAGGGPAVPGGGGGTAGSGPAGGGAEPGGVSGGKKRTRAAGGGARVNTGVRGEGTGVREGVASPQSDHHSLTPSPHHPITPVAVGRETGITAGDQSIAARWHVYEVGDLLTSHTENLTPTPGYPKELQPRDRTRLVSREQIANLAQNLNPALLGENPLAQNGAPIIGPDGAVESGNARTIALKQAYRTNSPAAERYRAWLAEHAGDFGLSPEDVAQAKEPVLVRLRTTALDPAGRVRFTEAANETSTAELADTEQARVDARRLTPAVIHQLHFDDEVNLGSAANNGFMRAFIAELPATEHAGLRDKAGKLTQKALNRVRNALFYAAYGDEAALERLAESTDDKIRNVSLGFLRAAGAILDLKTKIAAGAARDLDLSGDLSAAAGQLASLKQSGTSVAEYLAQQTLEERPLTPFQERILLDLEANKRSGKRIAGLLADAVDIALASGDPRTESLFEGIAPPTKEEVWAAAVKRQQEIGKSEPSLFAEGEAGAAPAAGGGAPAPAAVGQAPPGGAGQKARAAKGAGGGVTESAPDNPKSKIQNPKSKLRAHSGKITIGPGVPKPAEPPVSDLLSTPEAQAAWAKGEAGLGPGDRWHVRAWEGAKRAARELTRPYPLLGRDQDAMRAALVRREKFGEIAKQDLLTDLRDAWGGLTDRQRQLFDLALVMREMPQNLDAGQGLVPGFTEEQIKRDLPGIEAAVAADPKVAAAIAADQAATLKVLQAHELETLRFNGQPSPYLKNGPNKTRVLKDPDYWHHEVFEHGQAEPGPGTGGRRVQKPGKSGADFKRQEGDEAAAYSFYYPEAKARWVLDKLRATEELKLHNDYVKPQDRAPQLAVQAAAYNDPQLAAVLKQLADPVVAGRLLQGQPLPGLDIVGEKAAAGALPDEFGGRWEGLHKALGSLWQAQQQPGVTGGGLDPALIPELHLYAKFFTENVQTVRGRPVQPKDVAKLQGYKPFQYDPGNHLYRSMGLSMGDFNTLMKLSQEGLIEGLDLKPQKSIGAKKYTMLLPAGVADTLSALPKLGTPASAVGSYQWAMRQAKVWQIGNLFKVGGVLAGKGAVDFYDVSRTLMRNPESLLHLPRTTAKTYADGAKLLLAGANVPDGLRKTPTQETRDFLHAGGVSQLFGHKMDLSDPVGRGLLAELAKDQGTPAAKAGRILLAALRPAGLVKAQDFLFTYQLYLEYERQWAAHGHYLNYGASNDAAIREIAARDHKQASYQLARELIGDPDAISHGARAVRDRVPGALITFLEAKARAQWGQFRQPLDAPRQRIAVGKKLIGANVIGERAAAGLTVALSFGALALASAALPVALWEWNHRVTGNIEENLSPFNRDKLSHVNIPGVDADGNATQITHISLSPAFDLFTGIHDTLGYTEQYRKGRMTLGEIGKDMASQWGDSVMMAMGPGPMFHGLATGWDAMRQQPIRDKREYIARAYGVSSLWNGIAHYPERDPLRQQALQVAALRGTNLPENNYNETRQVAAHWLRSQTGDPSAGAFMPKDNALYYYKKALEFGDTASAEKFLRDYVIGGGKDEGVAKSLLRMEPLSGASAGLTARFIESLDGTEQARLKASYQFWLHFAAPMIDQHALDQITEPLPYVLAMRSVAQGLIKSDRPVSEWLGTHPEEWVQVETAKAERQAVLAGAGR